MQMRSVSPSVQGGPCRFIGPLLNYLREWSAAPTEKAAKYGGRYSNILDDRPLYKAALHRDTPHTVVSTSYMNQSGL